MFEVVAILKPKDKFVSVIFLVFHLLKAASLVCLVSSLPKEEGCSLVCLCSRFAKDKLLSVLLDNSP